MNDDFLGISWPDPQGAGPVTEDLVVWGDVVELAEGLVGCVTAREDVLVLACCEVAGTSAYCCVGEVLLERGRNILGGTDWICEERSKELDD